MSLPVNKALFAPARVKRDKVINLRVNPAQEAVIDKLVAEIGCKMKARLLLLAIGFADRNRTRFLRHCAELMPSEPEQDVG